MPFKAGILNPSYKHGKSHLKGYQKEYRKNNLIKSRFYHMNKIKRAQFFRDKVKDRPCLDCSIKYPPYVMQFDHRNPKEKLFPIGSNYAKVSHKSLIDEIAKCDVVCANCHAIRTYHRRKLCEK